MRRCFRLGGQTLRGRAPIQVSTFKIVDLPSDATFDEYAADALSRVGERLETWEMTSQSKLRMGGREASIFRGSYDLSEPFPDAGDLGRAWLVGVVIVDEEIGWAIACGTAALEASEAAGRLETCEQVVRSFEFLTP